MYQAVALRGVCSNHTGSVYLRSCSLMERTLDYFSYIRKSRVKLEVGVGSSPADSIYKYKRKRWFLKYARCRLEATMDNVNQRILSIQKKEMGIISGNKGV